MKPEDHAWRALQDHAAAQLHGGFAERVLRAAQGPRTETWRELLNVGARQLRPGFAERVLRAAKAAVDMPSLASQFALSAVTAAMCLAAVLFVHERNAQEADERNLAQWQQMVLIAQDDTAGL
ncbi:MAG: hypothetical protein ACREH8_17600 [Opitutaceae bacterium]